MKSAPSADITTGTNRTQPIDTEPTYTEILEISPTQYFIEITSETQIKASQTAQEK